jgi:hypothetical protein
MKNAWLNKLLQCLIILIAFFYSCEKENNQSLELSEKFLMQKMDSLLESRKLKDWGIVYKKTIRLSHGNSITYLRSEYRQLTLNAFLGIYYNSKFYLVANERTPLNIACDSITDIQPYRKKYLDFVLTQMYIDKSPDFTETLFATNILYFLLDYARNPHSKGNITNSMINLSQESIQKVIRENKCAFLSKHFKDNSYRINKINMVINGSPDRQRILIQYLEPPDYFLKNENGIIDSTISVFTPHNYINIETYIFSLGGPYVTL